MKTTEISRENRINKSVQSLFRYFRLRQFLKVVSKEVVITAEKYGLGNNGFYIILYSPSKGVRVGGGRGGREGGVYKISCILSVFIAFSRDRNGDRETELKCAVLYCAVLLTVFCYQAGKGHKTGCGKMPVQCSACLLYLI